MRRYGIKIDRALGIKVSDLRMYARRIVRDHETARGLWESGIHEARILATILDDPGAVNGNQMEQWAAEFDSWDIVDQACNNLFRKTPLAHIKALEWAGRKEEFVKRAGFSMMAVLAVHDRKAADDFFLCCLDLVERESNDDRYYVRKAVNWALRQIGKRSPTLLKAAMITTERVQVQGTRSAKWIVSNARRELFRVRTERGWK
jgi:3-methyladenine DNA glycosylase AlkD